VSGSLYATVVKNADAMLGAPVVTYAKPDGVRLLDTSRTVLDRSYTLVVAWKVSGDARYVERLQRDLDAAASFPDWNPDHFLDTAEMTHAFAVAYDWGYSYWDSAERARLRAAIVDKGLAPSQKVYAATSVNDAPYRYGGNWAMRADNINLVVNSAMAMGALAVAGETTSEVPQQVLQDSAVSIRTGLQAYAPDGGFKEGPTYWEYATRYLTAFLRSLKLATGSDYGLAAAPGLAQTAGFMEAMTGPGGQYYGFGDSVTQFQPAAAYAGLAAVFGDANRMALAGSVKSSGFAPLQLLLRDPALAAGAGAGVPTPLQNTFTAAGVTSMTGSRTDSRASYAAFRFGADPAGSHQHFDAGLGAGVGVERVDGEGVVALGAGAVVAPAHGGAVLGLQVVGAGLHAQVDRPLLAQCLEVEVTGVEVLVAAGRVGPEAKGRVRRTGVAARPGHRGDPGRGEGVLQGRRDRCCGPRGEGRVAHHELERRERGGLDRGREGHPVRVVEHGGQTGVRRGGLELGDAVAEAVVLPARTRHRLHEGGRRGKPAGGGQPVDAARRRLQRAEEGGQVARGVLPVGRPFLEAAV
jgi:hypothetical protein